MSDAFGSTSCPYSFVPESTLSHTPKVQYGLVPRLRHQGGKNRKNTLSLSTIDVTVNRGTGLIRKHGLFRFGTNRCFCFFQVLNPLGLMLELGFYLGACTQGKAYRNNIKDEVLT